MTDFDYENRQKKIIAQSAKHRKGGAKSRKCTLPSDHLTEAQKRKLNGPVVTVTMGKPMTWAQYKPVKDDLKKRYLIDLLNTYTPTGHMLGEMFGVTHVTVNKELRRLGLPVCKKGTQPTWEKKAAWAAFCSGGNTVSSVADDQIEELQEAVQEPQDAPEEQAVSQPAREEMSAENEAEEAEEAEEAVHTGAKFRASMSAFAARYAGEAEDVAQLIRNTLLQLNRNTRVKVKLIVEVCE